jgi:hypothetical protein
MKGRNGGKNGDKMDKCWKECGSKRDEGTNGIQGNIYMWVRDDGKEIVFR